MARASQVVLSENEYYLIKAPNGKVLEVKDFSTANGAFIQLWDYAGHPWQQWRFVDAGEGRWRIQNRFTGKMIDLVQDGVVEGTWLHQWTRTSGLSQCWGAGAAAQRPHPYPQRPGQQVHRPGGNEHLQRGPGPDLAGGAGGQPGVEPGAGGRHHRPYRAPHRRGGVSSYAAPRAAARTTWCAS